MSYTGAVTPGGPSAVRTLDDVVIRKASVSEQDNNAYLLTCRASGRQLLIDAADDAARLLALVAEGEQDGGRGLAEVLTTHQHWDHHRALAAVVEATGAGTLAGEADADAISVTTDRRVRHGDTLGLGDLHLDVIGLRGHTPGAVALLLRAKDGSAHLFSGDSLFPGGPGKTATQEHFASLMTDLERRVFDALPDGTWVYPGHGNDTTLGAERGSLGEWWARGW
jgi:glyoxylase-like metal-dependent hydrolase (beta-lactamase superfamily II)